MKCVSCKEIEGKPKFCSNKCAASYNNKGIVRNGSPLSICISEGCNIKTKAKKLLYCSMKCKKADNVKKKMSQSAEQLHEDKEKKRKYNSEYMIKRYHSRMKYMRDKLGGKCSVCQSIDDLEIDHIDPKSKSFDLSTLWTKNINELDAELNKCQLLCKSHHIEKTKSDWYCGNTNNHRPIGEDGFASKLSNVDVLSIRNLYADGYTQSELGNMFNSSKSNIHQIVTRKTWTHI